MKQFKYNLMQRAYLRETFDSVPVGSSDEEIIDQKFFFERG